VYTPFFVVGSQADFGSIFLLVSNASLIDETLNAKKVFYFYALIIYFLFFVVNYGDQKGGYIRSSGIGGLTE